MTGLLLLGLVPAGTPVQAGPAHLRLAGGALDALALPLGGLSADPATEAWAVEAALAQNAVLSAYAAAGDVLPVAIGAAFSGAAALARHLKTAGSALEDSLQRIAGRTEYIAQLLPDSAPATPCPAPATGAAYLRRRSAARAARQTLGRERLALADRVAADLGAEASTLLRRPAKPGALPVLCLLVERQRSGALIARARALSGAAGALGLRLRLIGPCPPHSFIDRPEPCDA